MSCDGELHSKVFLGFIFTKVTEFLPPNEAIRLGRLTRYVHRNLMRNLTYNKIVSIKKLIRSNAKFKVKNMSVRSRRELDALKDSNQWNSIEKLIFSNEFNEQVKEYPANVKVIIFGCKYNQVTENLSAGLKNKP